MDRARFLVGAFSITPALYADEKIREVIGFGADFIVSANADPGLLALCERYGLELLASGRVPFWWGGDGENAGQYAASHKPEDLAGILAEKPASPCIVGDYIVDEPNSRDFRAINAYLAAYRQACPGKLAYVNLYPNYASIPKNTDAECISQLGNASYLEHIQQYVREVDTDYICFDYYPFTGRVYRTYLENLDIVARACRESGRDMWVITQAGAWKAEEQIAEFQVRWQAYLCMAYGARSVTHACYCPAWWEPTTSCVDKEGNRNPMYGWAKRVNEELHALGDVYMRYRSIGVYTTGESTDEETQLQLEAQNGRNGSFRGFADVSISADGGLTIGCFKGENGRAVMLVNCRDPRHAAASTEATLSVKPGTKFTVYRHGLPQTAAADGKLRLALASGEGLFVVFG